MQGGTFNLTDNLTGYLQITCSLR